MVVRLSFGSMRTAVIAPLMCGRNVFRDRRETQKPSGSAIPARHFGHLLGESGQLPTPEYGSLRSYRRLVPTADVAAAAAAACQQTRDSLRRLRVSCLHASSSIALAEVRGIAGCREGPLPPSDRRCRIPRRSGHRRAAEPPSRRRKGPDRAAAGQSLSRRAVPRIGRPTLAPKPDHLGGSAWEIRRHNLRLGQPRHRQRSITGSGDEHS
jgi:hypothetical protein